MVANSFICFLIGFCIGFWLVFIITSIFLNKDK